MADLNVSVSDSAKVTDKLATAKRWFNGVKRFFTVKILPSRLK